MTKTQFYTPVISFNKLFLSYQPLNTPDITVIVMKFIPLSIQLKQLPPHGCSDPPEAVPLDVGHPSPRGGFHVGHPSPRGRYREVVVGDLRVVEGDLRVVDPRDGEQEVGT